MKPGVPKNARYVEQDDALPPLPEAGYLDEMKIHKGDYVTWSDIGMMKDLKASLFRISYPTLLNLSCL